MNGNVCVNKMDDMPVGLFIIWLSFLHLRNNSIGHIVNFVPPGERLLLNYK